MAWPRRLTTLLATAVLIVVCILILIQPPEGFGSSFAAGKHDKIRKPTPKPPLPTAVPISDNFPLHQDAQNAPSVPSWNKPLPTAEKTPLYIGFTRNWLVLQQAVVSYITAGWPPEQIFVVDNTGTMNSNKDHRLTLQNPFYLNYRRLTETLGVNVISTPTLLSFAQLQNFYLFTSIESGYKQYFWSHMDVIALPDETQKPYRSLYQRAVEVLKETTSPAFGKWGIRFFAYDRLALVNVEAYLDVGGWDTFIPFYGTDCDMHERLAMRGWVMKDAYIGFIYDMGLVLDDLRVLYREDTNETLAMCPGDTPEEKRPFGLNDCRYERVKWMCDDLQRKKQENKSGRNFWQAQQMGGQGEPFYRDPLGFDQAIMMSNENGQDIMGEKWGHQGCNIRGYGLNIQDQWRVEHDGDFNPPSVCRPLAV